MYTLAILAPESPAMERAFDAVATHVAAHAKVGAHVRAVGIQHVYGARLVAENG